MKKKSLLSVAFMALVFIGLAQVPDAFNYQAVIRNNSGEVLANQNVSFRISVLQGSESGTVLYAETNTVSTNEFGLVNLKIGDGTLVSGVFSPGGWGLTSHFLKVEFDPAGGSTWTHLGTSELLSVPYAFHAQTVQTDMVDDADADPANELQTISLVGSDLTLSEGGGTVSLPAGGVADNWGTQTVESDATLSGTGTSGDPLGVVGDLTDDQTLSLVGHDLTISEGNTVALPSDDWGTQTVESDGTLSGIGTSGDPLSVNGDLSDDQTLTLVGDDLSISNGNAVDIGGADNQTLSILGHDLTISNGNTVNLPQPAWPVPIWSTSSNDIYYSDGDVGINTVPSEQFHVSGNSRFDMGGGTINISTPGGWPGIIAFEPGGHRRDVVFRDDGIALTSSTSSASPDIKDGIWIRESGRTGIRSWYTGNYSLFVNQRGEDGIALYHESASSTWEIYSGSGGVLSLLHNTTMMGFFDGSTGVYTPVSDRRFKRNIKPMNRSLGSIQKLRPSTYEMKSTENIRREVGFIAQEVKDHFPELVHEAFNDKSGETFYTVNYNGIIVVAVKAIQEQQEIIEQQEKRIEALENKFERLQRRSRPRN